MIQIISIIFLVVFSFFLFSIFIKLSVKFSLIDQKNLHYSHRPTPTGSGIIFLILFIFTFSANFFLDENFKLILPNKYYLFLLSLFFLTIISFLDDFKSIDPMFRLIAQIFFVYLSISSFPLSTILLPQKFVFLAIVILWIYLINIHNFIDGTDGFLAINSIFFFFNFLLINHEFKLFNLSYYIAITVLPIMCVFLIFNKPKAKVYMGDAGSIFLGFLIGYIVLDLAIKEYWVLSLALVIYPILDCSIALIKKTFKGYMPWKGMYDYFFLIPALRNKENHLNIFIIILILNIFNTSTIFWILKTGDNYKIFINITITLITILIFKYVKIEKYFAKIKKNF